jgi:hypothetical protein
MPAYGSSRFVPTVTRGMAQAAAPTRTAINRQVTRTGSRPHIRISLAATAPAGVLGSVGRPPRCEVPRRAGRAEASIRRVRTDGHHTAAATVSAARPARAAATTSQSARAAASTATGPHPVGSSLSPVSSHGTEPCRSAVTSAGSSVPATASALIATAVTIVPVSCPRREPGPSTAPATVHSTLARASVRMTAARPATAGTIPSRAPRAISAANATAMNSPAGSSAPTASSENASRRRGSGKRLNTSGRSTGSPASALCAILPPSHRANRSASTSVAAAASGYRSRPSQMVPRADMSASPALASNAAGFVLAS